MCAPLHHDLSQIRTFKSPEMLAPARMPVAAGKKMANTEKKVSPPRKSGGKFSMKIFALKRRRETNRWKYLHFSFTSLEQTCDKKKSQLTIIIEDAFGFLIFSWSNEHSYKGVDNGRQQDDEEEDLCLFKQCNMDR